MFVNLINAPLRTTSTPKRREKKTLSLSYLDPKNARECIVIILILLGVTSNPKCTEEESVGAVWNSDAITKDVSLHINFIDN